MRMLCHPLLDIDFHPEHVDAARDEAKQPPLDKAAEHLRTFTVEDDLFVVNNSMVCNPFVPDANAPRQTNAQCENIEEHDFQPCSYQTQHAAGEL